MKYEVLPDKKYIKCNGQTEEYYESYETRYGQLLYKWIDAIDNIE